MPYSTYRFGGGGGKLQTGILCYYLHLSKFQSNWKFKCEKLYYKNNEEKLWKTILNREMQFQAKKQTQTMKDGINLDTYKYNISTWKNTISKVENIDKLDISLNVNKGLTILNM